MTDIALYTTANQRFVAVSYTFLNHYMPQANGEFVKVYLSLLQAFSLGEDSFSSEKLADRLFCTEGDILRALRYWEEKGLLKLKRDNDRIIGLALAGEDDGISLPLASRDSQEDAPAPDKVAGSARPGSHLSREKLDKLKKDEEFSQLLFIAESYLGKPLTSAEINSLDYYYEQLDFPVDLIEYLVEYCVSKGHKSFRYIETVALSWHAQGINTIEQARSQASQYSQQYYSVLKAFGVSGRSPIEQEIKMIDHWMKDYGFDTPLICEACSRTIQQINKVSFAYADSILSSWKEQNVRSRQDIDLIDARHDARKQAAKPAGKDQTKTAKAASQSRFNNFTQRSYDYKKLEQQLLGTPAGPAAANMQKEE